jgi:hypothetical protein
MPDSTLAGVISAVAGVITALSLLIASAAAYVKAKSLTEKVDEVHKIVNQQRTDMMRYQAALIKALKGAGVDVPDDQSNPEE